MTAFFGSGSTGTRFSTVAAGLAIVVFTQSTLAQARDTSVDPDVFRLFLESRIQKPADQATATERTAAINELADIYAVTNLPRAAELGADGRIKSQLELQRRAILFNAFALDFLAKNPASEQEIFNMYETQVALEPPKEFKARHILVASQSEALELVKELEGGADFAELAKSESTGPSGANGGDLGWFAGHAMVKPFSDAVVELENGAYTAEPVQTQFGWHVILREDSREGTAAPLDSVRDALKNQVEQQKFQAFVKGLREQTGQKK